MAERLSCHSLVLTFDPHPSTVLRPEAAIVPLTTIARRAELIVAQGIHWVVICQTNRQFLSLSAEEFFSQVVEQQLDARGVVEGPNFFYGRGRAGNVDLLRRLCNETGRECEIILPQTQTVSENPETASLVSSSRVRENILAGDLATANRLLTAPYRLCGVVTTGDARGRLLGFPTANLTKIPVLLPGPGVYATRAFVDGRWRMSATHIGPNLTFGQNQPKVEVHVLDFSGNLYGQQLAVDFIARVRDIAKFSSADALRNQLSKDLAVVRTLLEGLDKNP